MKRRRGLGWRIGVPAAVVVAAVLGLAATPPRGTVLPLRADGVALGPGGTTQVVPAGSDVEYRPGTSLLTSADLEDDADLRRQVADERAWLENGEIPGAGSAYADMAARALLDLRLLTSPDGAVIAAPVTAWKHVWPRDAAFVAAAFAATGHHADAERVLRFLAGIAPSDGHWEARYLRDGSGAVPDDRPPQLDGSGWVPWAVWTVVRSAPDAAAAASVVELMGPAVIASAEAVVSVIGADGMPPASSDYWERDEDEVTLGVVAPLAAGLNAAIDLAPMLGVDAVRWEAAADRLDGAIHQVFGADGYPRTVPDGGLDAAVSILAPPFAPADADVADAVVTTENVLRVPNGGHRPGEAWTKDVEVAWTPETAMLALAMAGLDRDDDARRLLTFLDEHRTALGALPEKVDSNADAASVAPLAWTASLVLLTLTELEDDLPVVPR